MALVRCFFHVRRGGLLQRAGNWRKDHVVFNLDSAAEVAQVPELEVQAQIGCASDSQINEYRRLSGSRFGDYIVGYNQDFVDAASPLP